MAYLRRLKKADRVGRPKREPFVLLEMREATFIN